MNPQTNYHASNQILIWWS